MAKRKSLSGVDVEPERVAENLHALATCIADHDVPVQYVGTTKEAGMEAETERSLEIEWYETTETAAMVDLENLEGKR